MGVGVSGPVVSRNGCLQSYSVDSDFCPAGIPGDGANDGLVPACPYSPFWEFAISRSILMILNFRRDHHTIHYKARSLDGRRLLSQFVSHCIWSGVTTSACDK